MKGYKAFNEDWTCNKLQYKVGEKIEHKGKVELCKTGLHFCENPLDVLRYYSPIKSKFAEVESDKVSGEKEKDSKRVCGCLEVKAELKLDILIKLGVDWIIEHCKKATSGYYSHSATSGYYSHSATSGYYSHSATSGDYSPSATSGDYSHSATSGKNSIAAAIGRNAQAKAAKNEWIVLAEYDRDGNVLCVRTGKVDGKKIEADTFYKLEGGKFKKAE